MFLSKGILNSLWIDSFPSMLISRSTFLLSRKSAISSKSTVPILINVMVEAAENKIKLSATDLEVSTTCVIEANVAKAGATTILGRKLFISS